MDNLEMDELLTTAKNTNSSVPSGQTEVMNMCDKTSFGFIFLPFSYSVVFLFSVAGNGMVLLHYIMKKKSSSKLFMVHLAALDLLMSLTLPLVVAYRAQGSDWSFGEKLCMLYMALFYGNLYGGNLFMLCICMDRFVAVRHPLVFQKWKQNPLHWLLSLVVWIIIFAFILWSSLSLNFLNPQPDGTRTCGSNFSYEQWHNQLGLLIVTVTVVAFFIPYVTIGISYALIARRLMTSRGTEPKYKSLKAIFTLISIMTICFLPFHIVQIVNVVHRLNAGPGEGGFHSICVGHRLLVLSASLNSMLDPFVYYFFSYDLKLNLFCSRRCK